MVPDHYPEGVPGDSSEGFGAAEGGEPTAAGWPQSGQSEAQDGQTKHPGQSSLPTGSYRTVCSFTEVHLSCSCYKDKLISVFNKFTTGTQTSKRKKNWK